MLPLNSQGLMYQPSMGGDKVVRVRRFCIDDAFERAEYEKIATAHANKQIRFVKPPSEIYSQKEDKMYMLCEWME